jgi:D-sedoheptulose 7-phosphate isomerase
LRESDLARRQLTDTIQLLEEVRDRGLETTLAAAEAIVASLQRGGKVLLFGNGGSAADAQHVAAELVGRFLRSRRGYAAIALTSDACVTTSIANDYGYETVFARQIEALGQRGDIAFGISTSGRSPNVLRGLENARRLGLRTVLLTGSDAGGASQLADIVIAVPSTATPRIQEVHTTLLHVMCDLIESTLAAEQ